MASILSQWKNKNKGKISSKNSIEVTKSKLIPLSHGQEQLWFLQKLYPNNSFYNYAEVYVLKGNLNIDYLKKAILQVVIDHDVLRSIYIDHDGHITQKVGDALIPDIEFYDFSRLPSQKIERELSTLSLKDAKTKFNLEKGPLLKFSLAKSSNLEHHLFVTLNHIITDKWSMMVFREQIALHYRQLLKNIELVSLRPRIQYFDYAYNQKKINLSDSKLDYWKAKLKGEITPLNFPLDYKRPLQPTFKGLINTKSYNTNLSQDILAFAKKIETTPYVLFLTVYYILLHKYSAQKDICVGSPVANRNHKDLEELIGFFNDTIVLRTKIESEITFSDLVKEVRKTTLDAFSNKEIPFDLLVKTLKPKRALNLNPFFQVMFIYHKVPKKPVFGDDLSIEHVPSEMGAAKFDLTLYVAEEEGIISPTIEYATDLFKEDTIVEIHNQLIKILGDVIKNPQLKISDISLKEKKENTFIDKDLNKLVNTHNGIHSFIEKIALKNPNEIAVTFGNSSITYTDLNKKATIIAQSLLEKTKGENQIVGLCVNRSIEMIIGLLGILKSGCAYLPIDPDYPKQRINYMVTDADVNYILTQKEHIPVLEKSNSEIILIRNSLEIISNIELPVIRNEKLAYVIYTSGSTGKPKGVPITHKNILTSTLGRFNFYEHKPTSFLLFSSIAFDSSKAGLFWTLCSGGNLVISEKRLEQNIHQIEETIKKNKVSHTLMLPTLYNLILEHAAVNSLKTLNTVAVAGEACLPNIVQKHFDKLPNTLLYNEYGPTEATVWCIAHKINIDDVNNTVPIGKAVANAEIYLLDENLKVVADNEIGQIYIGGPGLSGIYINRPDLTQEAYIDNPFATKIGTEKLYKTGDLARYRKDGAIEFLGRVDQQVKIRGYRVETSEIEKVLLTNTLVDDAVVVVDESKKSFNPSLHQNINNQDLLKLLKTYLTDNEIDKLISSTLL